MDLLNELRRARSSPKTILGRLLTDYKPSGRTVHAFFEGQGEESFYVNFIKHSLPTSYQIFLYRCNSKNNVYDVHSKVDISKFETHRLLFFVDRDYSSILKEKLPEAPNIYVTKYYSIENYLVSDEILVRYLRDILHLDEHVEDEQILVRHFREQLNKFYEITLVMFAWIIFIRRSGQQPILNNIKMAKLYKVTDALNITPNGRKHQSLLEQLEVPTAVKTPTNSWKQLRAIVKELKSTYQPKEYVRGKFELWFFVEFINKIPDLLNSIRLTGTKRVIVRTNITLSNAIEILGPRLTIPDDLRIFLESHTAKLSS